MMVKHYWFRYPLRRDSSWRAFLYEFGQREREGMANESIENDSQFVEHIIWKRCAKAGYDRFPKRIPLAKRGRRTKETRVEDWAKLK